MPPKKKTDPEPAAEPKPGQVKNISGDPVWHAQQTVPPDGVIDVDDVTAMPADIWETL